MGLDYLDHNCDCFAGHCLEQHLANGHSSELVDGAHAHTTSRSSGDPLWWQRSVLVAKKGRRVGKGQLNSPLCGDCICDGELFFIISLKVILIIFPDTFFLGHIVVLYL